MAHTDKWYIDRYNATKAYHKYSFRQRKKFTPQQKTAITKQYKKLEHVIKTGITQDRAAFKQVKDKTTRKALSSQYITTNKGIFVWGLNVGKPETKIKVSTKGKGKRKKAYVTIKRKRYIEVFYPVEPDFENIIDLINWIWENVPNVYTISLAVNQYHSKRSFDRNAWERYEKELLTLEEEITNEYTESPFIGAYVIHIS